MMNTTNYKNFQFVARLDHIKSFYAGIKAISFAENAFFQVNSEGLRITVENDKSVQASLFVTASSFAEFHVEDVTFSVNMPVLSECFALHGGTKCSMKMYYKGDANPLLIIFNPFDEVDISTECSLKITNDEQPIDYNIDANSSTLNVVFVRGPDLAGIFNDLDKTAEELEITLSPTSPYFKINILGIMQSESSVEVANSSNMMQIFQCNHTTSARYKYAHMRMALKALACSVRAAIRTDASGLLEFQFLLHESTESEIYVQFYITPLIDSDD